MIGLEGADEDFRQIDDSGRVLGGASPSDCHLVDPILGDVGQYFSI